MDIFAPAVQRILKHNMVTSYCREHFNWEIQYIRIAHKPVTVQTQNWSDLEHV